MNGVVMLVNEFAPISGGAEKQAERLAGYMAARGRNIMVITRRFRGLPSTEMMNGFQVIRPVTWGLGKLKTITFITGTLWILWRFRRQYSILHAHMLFGPAFTAALAGHFLGKRVIVKLGSSGSDGEIQTSLRTIRGRVRLAFLRRWANLIITLDEIMYQEALSAGFSKDKVYRMTNGIDVSLFDLPIPSVEAQHTLGFNGKTVVLFVGRLVPQKSLPTLLKAFAQAVETCPNLYLVLVGNGPELEKLQVLVADLKIKDDVLFAGNQPNVIPYLQVADIFVLPSETEGMSNALMEGMASGLPCLATPVGASPEMLGSGKYGVLVPVGDIDAWAKALVDLAVNPIRRRELGDAARQRIKTEYDFSVVGARYDDLYQRLTGQG